MWHATGWLDREAKFGRSELAVSYGAEELSSWAGLTGGDHQPVTAGPSETATRPHWRRTHMAAGSRGKETNGSHRCTEGGPLL